MKTVKLTQIELVAVATVYDEDGDADGVYRVVLAPISASRWKTFELPLESIRQQALEAHEKENPVVVNRAQRRAGQRQAAKPPLKSVKAKA